VGLKKKERFDMERRVVNEKEDGMEEFALGGAFAGRC